MDLSFVFTYNNVKQNSYKTFNSIHFLITILHNAWLSIEVHAKSHAV